MNHLMNPLPGNVVFTRRCYKFCDVDISFG